MRAATLQHSRPGPVRFVAIALFASTLEVPLALGQSLIADPDRLDLGAGHVSEVLVGQVRLFNTSEEPVRLYAVEPSCDSCTEVAFTNGWIEPGAFSEVEVRLRCEKDKSTKLVQSLMVHCSDRARPRFKVVLEGCFEPAVVIPTSRIDLGMVRPGEGSRVEVEVFNWLSEPVRLAPAAAETLDSSHGAAVLLVEGRSESGPGMSSLPFHFAAPCTVGPTRTSVTWLTGLDSQPSVSVEVTAIVAASSESRPRFWIPVPGGLMYPFGVEVQADRLSENALTEQRDEGERSASPGSAAACGPQRATEITSTQGSRGER